MRFGVQLVFLDPMMQGRLGTSGHLTLTPLNRRAAPAAPEIVPSAQKYWRVWVVLTAIHLCQGSSCQRANVLSKHVSGALSDWRPSHGKFEEGQGLGQRVP